MLNIPGRAGRTCEGPTRRELMRIGSLGLAGPASTRLLSFAEGSAGKQRRGEVRRRARLRQRQERHHDLPARRTESHRHLGPQAGCACQHSRRIQADQDQDSRARTSASTCR